LELHTYRAHHWGCRVLLLAFILIILNPSEAGAADQYTGGAPRIAEGGTWNRSLSYIVATPEEALAAYLDAVKQVPEEIIIQVTSDRVSECVNYLDAQSMQSLSFTFGFSASYNTKSILLRPEYTQAAKITAHLQLNGYVADQYIQELAASALRVYQHIINPAYTPREQVQAVHDYIITQTEYDNLSTDIVIGDVAGVLEQGRANCSGYANTFQLFMNLCGIESMVVGGISTDQGITGNHAWNKVYLDDNWYNIDVTWDDPLLNGGTLSQPFLQYYLVDDDFLSRDHTWDHTGIPSTTIGSVSPHYSALAAEPETDSAEKITPKLPKKGFPMIW